MTLDQVFMLMADKKILRKSDKPRILHAKSAGVVGKDGLIRGRAHDGTPIIGKLSGKSKARMMMEEQQQQPKRKRRRRRKRGN